MTDDDQDGIEARPQRHARRRTRDRYVAEGEEELESVAESNGCAGRQ